MWAVSPIPCFIGSVASIGGGSIPLQVSMVWVCPSVRCRAMILRCRAVRCGRCPLSPASSVRWLPLVAVLFLAGFNGSGVSPLYCFPLQVRAVVAMVKFSHLTNFVLNKKLGCIIQNCALGGCPLSSASSARWLPLVGGSFLFYAHCAN